MGNNVSFDLKKHTDGREYIQYTITNPNDRHDTVFHNAAYARIDTTSREFKELTKDIGGFYANMTTRRIRNIKDNGKGDTAFILLCCIPRETSRFLFLFAYLDKDENILDTQADDNWFDYEFFYVRLKPAIVKEGLVYNLEKHACLKSITDQIHPHPSMGFGVTIEGKDVQYGDTLYCKNFTDILNREIADRLRKLGGKYITLEFDCSPINFIHLACTIMDGNNKPIKDYQATSGIKDLQEYIQAQKRRYGDGYGIDNVVTKPFVLRIQLSILPNIAKYLSYEKPENQKN